jgi:hypothetical protein
MVLHCPIIFDSKLTLNYVLQIISPVNSMNTLNDSILFRIQLYQSYDHFTFTGTTGGARNALPFRCI